MKKEKKNLRVMSTLIMNVKTELSEERKKEIAEELSKAVLKKLDLDLKFSDEKKEWKSKIDDVQGTIDRLADTYDKGYETEPTDVDFCLNFLLKNRVWIRKDNGVIIKEEPFKEDDHQLFLEFQDENKKKGEALLKEVENLSGPAD